MDNYQLFINGEWVDSAEDERAEVENPATTESVATVPAGCVADAERALQAAEAAQPQWRALPAGDRAQFLLKLVELVEREEDRLARVLTQEVGKPLQQGYEELGATKMFLVWAAESARRTEGDIMPSDFPQQRTEIHRVPYGVVLALTAWNFPSALAARKLGPALVAGNTVVVKPHEITPLSALELARLVQEAEFPPGVVNVVTGAGKTVGEFLVSHPITRLVTMTGSVRAGREIMRAAAESVTMVRLELGGKAPFIVMEDADIEATVEALVGSRFYNCGQVCTCPERAYLHRDIADSFMALLIERVNGLRLGDPMENPDMGPKVSRPELEKVEAMVQQALESGAKAVAGGSRPEGEGFARGHWYSPTVLVDVSESMEVMSKEIFGPVLPVATVEDFDEAIELANATPYGLSSFVFTNDYRRIARLPELLDFGEIYINRAMGEAVNGFHTGHGLSGIGGEDGKYGLDAYYQKTTVYMNYA